MKLPGFLSLGNPWLIAIVAATALASGTAAGWKVATWRAGAQQAAVAREAVKAVQATLDASAAQATRDAVANAALSDMLQKQRKANMKLSKDIENAKNLYSPVCTANPFGPDFKRLWDASASGRALDASTPQ